MTLSHHDRSWPQKILAHIARNRDCYIYLIIVLAVLLRCFINYPSITWRAEFWAESGTNFFCHAQETFSFANILILDSGYLAILPRLLSFLIVTVFNAREYSPHLQQIAAFILIGIMAGSVLRADWGERNKNQVLRYTLAGALISHWGYGMFVFNNLSYFAVIPAIAILGYPTNLLKRNIWPFAIIMPILMLNKPYLLAFAPIYLIFAIYLIYKREAKASIPFWTAFAMLVTQFFVAYINRGNFAGSSVLRFSSDYLALQIKSAMYFSLYAQEALFSGFYTRHFDDGIRSSIAIFIATIQLAMFVIALFTRHFRAFYIAMSAFVVAYLCEFMTSVVFFPEPLDFSLIPSFLDDSHHFFAFSLFLIGTSALLAAIFDKYQWVACLLLLAVCASSNVFGFFRSVDPVGNGYPEPTQWERQIHLLERRDEFISINPPGWKFRPSDCAKISP